MPECLLLVVWSSIGLWVGLVCGFKFFTLRWVALGWVSRLVGWVEEIGPTDNSMLTTFSVTCLDAFSSINQSTLFADNSLNSVHACHVNRAAQYMLVLHGEGDDGNSAG